MRRGRNSRKRLQHEPLSINIVFVARYSCHKIPTRIRKLSGFFVIQKEYFLWVSRSKRVNPVTRAGKVVDMGQNHKDSVSHVHRHPYPDKMKSGEDKAGPDMGKAASGKTVAKTSGDKQNTRPPAFKK